MRIPVKFAELHLVLFMNGNLGTKISPAGKTGLSMLWDTEMKSLIIQYNNMVSLIPEASVASWQPTHPADIGIIPVSPAPARTITTPTSDLTSVARNQALTMKTAQVSDPTKPITGLTGLEGAPKYKPHPATPKKTRLEVGEPTPPKPDKDDTH